MSFFFRTCARKAERRDGASRRAAGLALAIVVGACAAPREPGEPVAAPQALHRETQQLIETFGRARLECERVQNVHVEPMPADRPVPGAPAGATREHWIVTGCERRAVFEVTYVPGQDGGTRVDVQPWGEVRDAACPPDRSISSAPSGGLAERLARAGRQCP